MSGSVNVGRNRNIRRARVYRYKRSGKLSAVLSPGDGYIGLAVLDLSPDMRSILSHRNPKFVKRDALEATRYQVELIQNVEGTVNKITTFGFQVVRVLSPDDVDLTRWTTTASLRDLPVSPEPEITVEELAWAGKRAGNLGGGITLALLLAGAASTCIYAYLHDRSYYFPMIVAAVVAWFLLRYKWKAPQKPDSMKLTELTEYKASLRASEEAMVAASRTHFEKALEDLDNWIALTPKQFEYAVALRLEKEGYRVKVTQYSKDGGVDAEGTDKYGAPIIVQAKRFGGKVGVAVVREIMGARQTYASSPRAIIYSLSGFTRGAKDLAEQHDIELRTIKTEILEP